MDGISKGGDCSPLGGSLAMEMQSMPKVREGHASLEWGETIASDVIRASATGHPSPWL